MVDLRSTERLETMRKEQETENKEKVEEKQTEEKVVEFDPKDQKIIELTESLQRLQAEFENFKKRTDKEKQDFCKYAEKELMIELLPVLDNFELALKNTKDNSEFIKGVELIYVQLVSGLEKKGLKIIETQGKFDPHKHEVLLQEESDKDSGEILEELQKGYQLNETILRTAKVKVSK
jgi:molecular chaperone GrpE